MICIVDVDDTIFVGPDADAPLLEMIKSLGVSDDEKQHIFEVRSKSEVGDFLTAFDRGRWGFGGR
jgi:hypothetical protein